MEFDSSNDFLEAEMDDGVPSMDKIESLLDGMDVTEEQRAAFLRQLLGGSKSSAGLFTPLNVAAFVFAALLFNLILFFGYKLYKSIKDKESKREEKRKARQLKKKK